MISHAMLFTLSGSAQDTADKTKVARNVWKVHNMGFGAQQSLGIHLIWRSLACGGRHGAQPGEDRSTCTGHIKGGVGGGALGLEGPLFLSDWAGGTAEPQQLLEGTPLPLVSVLCFLSACSSNTWFTLLHEVHHREAAICHLHTQPVIWYVMHVMLFALFSAFSTLLTWQRFTVWQYEPNSC